MQPILLTQLAAFKAALSQASEALRAHRFEQVVALLDPWTMGPQLRPEALQLAGIALGQLGQWQRAADCQQRLVALVPHDLTAWINLANTQMALGSLAQAQESLDKALQLDPAQPAVHFNRGNLLMRQGAYDAACGSFRRASELAPDRPEPFCNHASALHALLRHEEALEVLRGVVARHPDLAAGWNLLGATWQRLGADRDALDCYLRAVQCDPGLVHGYSNCAQVLARLQRFDSAKAMARQAVEFGPADVTALRTLGEVLLSCKENEEARAWLEKARQIEPEDPFVLRLLLDQASTFCDWEAAERHLATLRRLWQQGPVDGLEPWRLLSYPLDGDELRAVTEMTAAKRLGRAGTESSDFLQVRRGQSRPERLRIGYFSADLHQHPVGVLVAGMLEEHDRSRFESVAFCLGRHGNEPDDPLRTRLRAAFDRFERVQHLGDAELARLARELDIHVAVDLSGHTENGRPGVFVRRVAPVQMHFIGYPGTLGMSGAVDYLVADRIVVPPELRGLYSEKIIELPDSYQANDRKRQIDTHVPSRQELGLPADGFVFCCFNQHYKITREVFGIWMALLRQRPGSVLWLQAAHEEAVHNLGAAAADQGIAPDRLVFAQRTAQLEQHLARQARADLFLDTWPYNAHATASDALWAGLPVLTCAGQTFASRVGASLLSACGLPQLVAHDPRSYLDKALELSSQPLALQALRTQLQQTRLQVPLFDTERFTRHIETAYDMAWDRFQQGLPPDHVSVPPRA